MSQYLKFLVLFLSREPRESRQSFLSGLYAMRNKKYDGQGEKERKVFTGCRAAAATATAAAAFIPALGYILSSEALEEVT